MPNQEPMLGNLDLFASSAPRTCGNCAHCMASRFGGHYCAMSLRDMRPEDTACTAWAQRINDAEKA